VNTPEIPAWDAENYADQDAERAWIAKYRLALESAASVQAAQGRGIGAAVRGVRAFLASNFGRLVRSLLRSRSAHIRIAAKRTVASTKPAQPQVNDVADAETDPAQKVS
jgi:hypothetical protein